MLRRGGLPCHPQPAVPHGIVDGSPARQGYRGPRKMKPKPRALVPRAIAPRRPAALLGAMVGLVLATAAVAGEASPWVRGPSFPGAARCRRRRRGGASCRDRDRPRSGFQDLLALARANPGCRRRSTGRGRKTSRRPRCSGRRRTASRTPAGSPTATRTASCCPVRVSPKRCRQAAAARPQARLRRLQGHLHPGAGDAGAGPSARRGAARRARAIAAALARVPRPQALGAPGDLSITRGIDPKTVDGKPVLAVAVRAPPERRPVRRGARGLVCRRRAAAAAPGCERRRRRPVHGRESWSGRRTLPANLELRLTLAAGERAVETAARLDTARLPR